MQTILVDFNNYNKKNEINYYKTLIFIYLNNCFGFDDLRFRLLKGYLD